MNILLGADPEVFVKNPKTGRFICAHGLIPGTKDEPFPVKDGAVQVDGFALEFNINPAATEDEWVNNLSSVKDQLAAMVPDYELAWVPVADFSTAHFRKQPEEARKLGCEPDYNAYTGEQNQIAEGAADQPFRTAAGHIHIGFTEDADPLSPEHMMKCCTLVKQLDLWLGLPSILHDKEGVRRRQLYGDGGAFRPKPYGCEYRVLSNWWLKNEKSMRWVYQQTIKCVESLMAGNKVTFEVDDYLNKARGDFDWARKQAEADTQSVRTTLRYYNTLNGIPYPVRDRITKLIGEDSLNVAFN